MKKKSVHELHSTRKVLEYVNHIRVNELGLKPLKRLKKGARNDSRECPIGRSLAVAGRSVWVNGIAMRIAESGKGFKDAFPTRLPAHVREWIDRFDRGRYPELVR